MQESGIDRLIKLIAKLPGLGPRSARRVVLHLFKHREKLLLPLVKALGEAAESIKKCEKCGNLDTISPCAVCADGKRDPSIICVVEEVGDLWAFERSNIFNGTYHILGGTLSVVDGNSPEKLGIHKLLERAANDDVEEVIIATNATVEGQTTAHYIMERMKDSGIKISHLAHGIPMGGELDYMDDGTLGVAFKARQIY